MKAWKVYSVSFLSVEIVLLVLILCNYFFENALNVRTPFYILKSQIFRSVSQRTLYGLIDTEFNIVSYSIHIFQIS